VPSIGIGLILCKSALKGAEVVVRMGPRLMVEAARLAVTPRGVDSPLIFFPSSELIRPTQPKICVTTSHVCCHGDFGHRSRSQLLLIKFREVTATE
jgi:hypothetical protein